MCSASDTALGSMLICVVYWVASLCLGSCHLLLPSGGFLPMLVFLYPVQCSVNLNLRKLGAVCAQGFLIRVLPSAALALKGSLPLWCSHRSQFFLGSLL